MKRVATAIACALTVSACSGSSVFPAPSPLPLSPPRPPANVAGKWTGQVTAQNSLRQDVLVQLTQTGASVNGIWTAAPIYWIGSITGTTDADSFFGTFTISAPTAAGTGPRCAGSARVSGPAGGSTLRWTSTGFIGSCAQDLVNLVWSLHSEKPDPAK